MTSRKGKRGSDWSVVHVFFLFLSFFLFFLFQSLSYSLIQPTTTKKTKEKKKKIVLLLLLSITVQQGVNTTDFRFGCIGTNNNGPHQDQIFDNPSALCSVLWARHRIRLRGGGGGGGWGGGGTDAPYRLFMKGVQLSVSPVLLLRQTDSV